MAYIATGLPTIPSVIILVQVIPATIWSASKLTHESLLTTKIKGYTVLAILDHPYRAPSIHHEPPLLAQNKELQNHDISHTSTREVVYPSYWRLSPNKEK
uniref:Uncharacterized protein n=1 Tax=Opuntia streptacantha TaxID=393608 RepID=A0A7C8YE45_OPUST